LKNHKTATPKQQGGKRQFAKDQKKFDGQFIAVLCGLSQIHGENAQQKPMKMEPTEQKT